MEILSSGVWNGIAAITGLIGLYFILYDRTDQNNLGRTTHLMVGAFVFALIGASYGTVTMALLGFLGTLFNWVGADSISGPLGRLLSNLSRFELGYWGFSQSISEIERQMSAAGLWIGSFFLSLFSLMKGREIQYDIKKVPRIFLIWPVAGAFMIIILAASNYVVYSNM